jgi:ribulose-phosphate 3-epimerase
MIKLGVQRICFHYESETHVDWMLNKIRKSGIQAGVALTPSTQISVLDYVIESCDFVMLMLINPGFAGNAGEQQVPYAIKKIEDCRELIESKGLTTEIEIDGRVSTDRIPDFVQAGANVLVLGSSSLFSSDASKETNLVNIRKAVAMGIGGAKLHEID